MAVAEPNIAAVIKEIGDLATQGLSPQAVEGAISGIVERFSAQTAFRILSCLAGLIQTGLLPC
jgi:hypothetical protein